MPRQGWVEREQLAVFLKGCTMRQLLIACSALVTFGSAALAQESRDPAVARLATAERQFARKIYAAVAQAKPAGNLVLAPYGVMESLTMLQVGARGESRQAIASVTGLRSMDAATIAAFERVRSSAFPTAYRFGAAVSDNGGYGVKIIDQTPASLSGIGIKKGDLIFTVDGRPVRTAREFIEVCSSSTGAVRLDGFSHETGRPFSNSVAQLAQVREMGVESSARVLNFASALWLKEGLVADSWFPDQLQQLFHTKTFATSFGSLDEIGEQADRFFAKETGGRIQRVNMPEQLKPGTLMMLMNAMAMDAKWERRFNSGLTKAGQFAAPAGEVEVKYMRQQGTFAFANVNGLRVIELPYRNTDLRMTVFLPATPDGWTGTERDVLLNDLELNNLARKMRPTRVDIKLPKFDIRMSGSLKSSIEAVGLESLFTKEADFRGIDARNRVMLDDMRQQVYVTTNEDGTRAGSVTQAVGILKSSAMKTEPFHATHPFLFLIRDSSGVIYFTGRVVKPRLDRAASNGGNPCVYQYETSLFGDFSCAGRVDRRLRIGQYCVGSRSFRSRSP